MTPRKPRDRRPNQHHQPQQHYQHQYQYHQHHQQQDYESDTQYYYQSDYNSNNYQQHQQHLPDSAPTAGKTPAAIDAAETIPPTPPVRSNEELNLSVLSRHNPSITSILSLAPYAVVYVFSPATQSWEKSGVEGSMFVCQRTQGSLGEERYCVFVLNRRGLNNFDVPLTDGANVEITEDYVILKTDVSMLDEGDGNGGSPERNDNRGQTTGGGEQIFGLWIYSEPPPNSTAETRTINARVIKECAVHAGQSLKMAREMAEAERAAHNGQYPAQKPQEPQYGGVAMGRQISLKELFGQQRAQDDAWSVKMHSPGRTDQQPSQWPQQQQQPPSARQAAPTNQPGGDVLGDLFRRAGLAYGT